MIISRYNKILLFLIGALLAALPFLAFPRQVQAQSGLVVVFDSIPLFENINIMPGDTESRGVNVNNTALDTDYYLAVKASEVDDSDGLGSQMSMLVRDSAQNVYFDGSLSDFFAAGAVPLSLLASSHSERYVFTVGFDYATGNEYQGKSLYFDIIIGTEGDEPVENGTFTAAVSGKFIPSDRAPKKLSTVVKGESGEPELVVSKGVNKNIVNPGETGLKYQIIVTNLSDFPAINVQVTDTLPDGLSYTDTAGAVRQWPVFDLEGNGTWSREYEVDVLPGAGAGEYENTVRVKADNHPPLEATATVKVQTVKVLGLSLIPSGFSLKEFIILLCALLVVSGGVFALKRKYKI